MPDSQAPHISLKRDAKGRIAERTLNLGGTPETRRYAYDSAGRLTQVTDERGALLESYAYDHQARRLADIRLESQPGNKIVERRFSYGHGDRLAAAGNAQYSHDRAGFRNLKVEGAPGLGGAETWYHYEPSGLLLAVDLPSTSAGGSRIEYAYDANGLRREKRLNGRLVAAYDWLDPLRLSEFFDGREWWRFAYLDNSKGGRTPVGVTNGRDSFLLQADQLGTPLALATLDGCVVQTMRYDSFGNLLESRGGVVDLPLGFAGGLFDQDTGLTRFVWRDYDAETGRFTALDPLREKGGDADFYGYCVDDPVNRADVWGLEGSWWDGFQKIGDGLGQLWDKTPEGIGQAVTEGTQGAGEAMSKTAQAYATNEDLQKYTAVALGAGAVPIVAAAGVEAAPALVAAAARNMDKIEWSLDAITGAFVPGPPSSTPAGAIGSITKYGYDFGMEKMRKRR